MSNAVPIVSVISGAAVAILVPLITAATQSGEKRREHRREQVTKLRECLVKCCFALADASTAAVNAARQVGVEWAIEVQVPDANDPESSYALFRERLHSLYRSSLILGLELGPDHRVCKAFDAAADLLVLMQVPLVDARSPRDGPAELEDIRHRLHGYFGAEKKFHSEAAYLLSQRERHLDRSFLTAPGLRRAH